MGAAYRLVQCWVLFLAFIAEVHLTLVVVGVGGGCHAGPSLVCFGAVSPQFCRRLETRDGSGIQTLLLGRGDGQRALGGDSFGGSSFLGVKFQDTRWGRFAAV